MKKKVVIIFFIIVLLLGFYLYYENSFLKVSNYMIKNNKIPDDFNNYKIVQVSDFHNTKSKKLTKDLVNEIEKIKPDIIVLTGDLIDANRMDINVSLDFIKKINNIAPVYFVSGNHEASIREYEELKEKLWDNNVTVLENESEIIKLNDAEINLIGISDPNFSPNSYITDEEIINDELKNIENNKDTYSILLSHRPELFDIYVENDMDLVLTGHAHGGQIRIPFIGGIVAPNQGLFPKYTSGIFENNKTTMIVSRGIGNSILPFRINNRPEMIVITLNNEK